MFSRRVIVTIAGLLTLLLIVALGQWSQTKRGTPPFLEGITPNAYDEFIRSIQMLQGTPQEGNPAEFVKTNEPALAAFRRGMKQKFEAPIETYNQQTLAATVMPNLAGLKALGLAVKAEGNAAQEEKDFTRAASIYLELMEYGQKIQHGPVIFLLVGLAVENQGFFGLQTLETKLAENEKKEVAARLEQLAAERITFEEVLTRERYFARRASPTPLHYLIGVRQSRAALEKSRSKHETMLRQQQEFIAKLKEGR